MKCVMNSLFEKDPDSRGLHEITVNYPPFNNSNNGKNLFSETRTKLSIPTTLHFLVMLNPHTELFPSCLNYTIVKPPLHKLCLLYIP